MEQELRQFLVKAKQSTYAGKGAETAPSRVHSHDLMYREGEFLYYDTYLGGEKFAGEEALWISENPYWCMNYIGRVTGAHFSGDFLKEALSRVPIEMPCRGPGEYSDGDYSYVCDINGSMEWFRGTETISYKGQEIYECIFHGGLIQ